MNESIIPASSLNHDNMNLINTILSKMNKEDIKKLTNKVDNLKEVTLNFGNNKSETSYCKLVTSLNSENRMERLMYKNIFDLLIDTSKDGRWFFNILFKIYKDNYYEDNNNIIFFQTKDLEPFQKKKIYNGFKSLKKQNIIKRYERNKYILNPDLIAPFKNYEEAKRIYDEK